MFSTDHPSRVDLSMTKMGTADSHLDSEEDRGEVYHDENRKHG